MSRASSQVETYPDAHAAALACGRRILTWLEQAIAERGAATLAISGGSSPRPMFEMFAGADFPWNSVNLFWVDERCVPWDDPQSNYRLARETWLAPARFPEGNIHAVQTYAQPEEAARGYDAGIRAALGLKPGELPQFDVIHRGMGADGHTASLFPGSPYITERDAIAAAVYFERLGQWRVTLTGGVLEAARHTAILATGADKAATLDAVLHGPYDPMRYPAQIASREGSSAVWFVDQAAAGAGAEAPGPEGTPRLKPAPPGAD
ncbi:MAG TPA: 6-phosphogluconolactonase [Bryobacteraceae bacterium]|nr:6-phosphogluconolactonase [Bryobacteraceae bacterium]